MHRRIIEFRTELDKAVYLNRQAHTRDQLSPRVQQAAKQFSTCAGPQDALEQLHRWVRDSVKYKHDPGGREQFADAETVLERRFDDCDGKARVFVAIATALGELRPTWAIEAEIVPHWRAGHFVHVSARARWRGSRYHVRANPQGYVPSDPIVGGLEFGQDPEEARDPRTGKIPTV